MNHSDRAALATLSAAAVLLPTKALTQHAIAPGSGESSVPGQVARALAYWTALQGDTEANGQYSTILTDVVAHLTAQLAYMNNPSTTKSPGNR